MSGDVLGQHEHPAETGPATEVVTLGLRRKCFTGKRFGQQ
jgi:hypothetical protein